MVLRSGVLRNTGLAAALLIAALGAAASAQVGADANISPKRVVFAAGDRSATVFVFNQGGAAATYSVETVERIMRPDGQIVALAELPDAERAAAAALLRSAGPMVQFTPRRVTLQPNQSQAIRVRALRPAGLAAGEYRTHLTVTAVPPEDAGLTAEQALNPAAGEVGVRVTALFSLSIPVIVRSGPADVRVAVENPRIAAAEAGGTAQGGQAVTMELVRQGASSVYGDVEVHAAGAGRGRDEVIGRVRGVGVYPEIDRRSIRIPLVRAPARGERLSVVFRDDDTRSGEALATAALPPGG